MSAFSYTLMAKQGQARAGLLTTPHGEIQTPVFMPVGTNTTVKSMLWPQVAATGAQIVLSNAYHLFLRPGHELIKKAGGLHGWMNWQKPILTDSGGFQIFSLSKFRKITNDGIWFQDVLTGNKHFMGPKESMAIQNALGADIIMAFDECPPYPTTHEYAKKSLDITNRWLESCFEHHARAHDQALFPIVQGSVFPDLRDASIEFISQFDSVGCAIGGVSVGETKHQINEVVARTAPLLPEHKPRYLMGVGTPEDILEGVRHGVDMFDCVMPTRIARHGSFFTPTGRKIIKNAEFKEDFGPLVEGCTCFTCQHHSRAYIRHLFRVGEQSSGTLLSIHNVHTLVDIAQQAHHAILQGKFEDFYHERMLALGCLPDEKKTIVTG